MRPRLAPRASRTAISFRRPSARASTSAATLAQATSSTVPTSSASTWIGPANATRLIEAPRSPGIAVTPTTPRAAASVTLALRASTGESFAGTCSIGTPGFIRPMICSHQAPAVSSMFSPGIICG